MQRIYARRKFIGKYFFLSSAILSASALFNRCNSNRDTGKKEKNSVASDPCEDLSEVSKNDIEVRTKAGYVKKSPLSDHLCGNCNLYIPAAAGKDCSGCMLFKGPVYADGYCIYWAPRA